MASLGSISFHSLQGHREPRATVVREITRPGVNGHAYRKEAQRAEPFRMIGWKDTSNMAAANTAYAAVKALQGTLVTLVDDYGTTTNDVIVEAVRLVEKTPTIAAVGGVAGVTTNGALLVVEVLLRQTGANS